MVRVDGAGALLDGGFDLAAFDAAGVLVRGYAGDGVRVTLADPATNDRVLAVLAAFERGVG